MAKLTYEPKVGDILYMHYTPSKVFKVTEVERIDRIVDIPSHIPHKYTIWEVKGVTPAGKNVSYQASAFPLFEALYEDHLRKAEKFKKIVDKLKAL